MTTRKTAKRILKQYGKHIKASEQKAGICVSLGKYNLDNYKQLVKTAK